MRTVDSSLRSELPAAIFANVEIVAELSDGPDGSFLEYGLHVGLWPKNDQGRRSSRQNPSKLLTYKTFVIKSVR
jgi:hypothetical protein